MYQLPAAARRIQFQFNAPADQFTEEAYHFQNIFSPLASIT